LWIRIPGSTNRYGSPALLAIAILSKDIALPLCLSEEKKVVLENLKKNVAKSARVRSRKISEQFII